MKRALLMACAIALLFAGSSLGEPKYTGTISTTAPDFKWEGGPLTGAVTTSPVDEAFPCGTPGVHECEDTLIKVESAGTVPVKIESGAKSAVDLDLYVYASDASGKHGKVLGESTSETAVEAVSAKVPAPGYIVVEVQAYTGADMTYAGTATLKPTVGAPPTTDLPPTAKLGKLAKSVKAKKLKTFKGTATGDQGVARVEIGVIRRKGSKCTQLTASGKFAKLAKCTEPSVFLAAKGTTSWSFKLKKRLAKGSYTLFARAVDAAGTTQAGFSSANRKSFRVK
jgi:hypothetical protein